jgi:hypothetical protein
MHGRAAHGLVHTVLVLASQDSRHDASACHWLRSAPRYALTLTRPSCSRDDDDDDDDDAYDT